MINQTGNSAISKTIINPYVCQRAPHVPGTALGFDDVDGEDSGAEWNELNVGDVVDALEVRLLQDVAWG